MTTNLTYHVTSGIPYPLSNAKEECFHRPSFSNTAESRFAMLSPEKKADQTLRRAEYGIINLYEILVSWFCNDQKQFRTYSFVAPGSHFGWSNAPGSGQFAFARWVPIRNPKGIEKIAFAVTCGAYKVSDQRIENVSFGYGGFSNFDDLNSVHEIYERACWEYAGPPLPKPPLFAGWKRHLAWFEKCRDIIGATEMLKAYALGVPLEDIVLTPIKDEQNAWYREKQRKGGYEAGIKAPRFPNISR